MTEIPGFAAGGSYLDYLMPGVVVMTALFSSGWSGMGIIEDIDRGLMDRFLVAPIHRSSLIGGRVAYEAISLILQSLIIGGLALLLGAQFAGGPLGFAVLVLCAVLLGAAFAALSDASALSVRQREVGHRPQHVHGPAADLPLGGIPAARAGARTGSRRWPGSTRSTGRSRPAARRSSRTPTGPSSCPGSAGCSIVAIACLALATRAFRSYQRSA